MPGKKDKAPRSPVGLIGLGLMGLAMAERLHQAGFVVIGWDLAPKARAAFKRRSGRASDNAAQVFERCDRVLLALPDSHVVAAMLSEVTSTLHPGHVILDTSTGDPQAAVQLAALLASSGVHYLDATISGSSEQLSHGDVLVMAGGSKAAFRQCAGLFRAFARETIHTGPSGSGAKMKLVTNLVLGLNRAALAEGLNFADALELDGRKTLAILRASMAYSRIMDTKGEKMLQRNFKPQARLSQHLKDVRLMIAAAKQAGAKLPLSEVHRRILETAEAAGLGQLDNSAIIRITGTLGSGAARHRHGPSTRRNGVSRAGE
jgi:3-hydroxyisobutyrate dehydrogenase-like beta-hydroxyacid dehydrogenase